MFLTQITGKKSLMIFGIIIVALIAGFIVLRNNKKVDIQTESVESLVEDLENFEIKDEALDEARKQKLYEQFELARKSFRESYDIYKKEGENTEATMYWPVLHLGNIHRDAGDYKKAERAYLFAHKTQPLAYPPVGNLGELYNRYFKDYKKAEEYYLLAVESDHDSLETYYSELYQIYRYRMNDMKKAEEILISGTQKYPARTNILADLALHYRETGHIDKAIESYKKLLEIYPESMVAKNALLELQKP